MDDNLQQAIALIKSGQKKQGGQILAEIVKQQPNNESAWLWLAHCVNTNQQKIYCLNKALEINPQNGAALTAIQKLQEENEVPQLQFADNRPVENQTNTFSIASIISSLLGWLFGALFIMLIVSSVSNDSSDSLFMVPAILANLIWIASIVTGYVGLKQIKAKGTQKGDGLSKSGMIISSIGCSMMLCLLAFLGYAISTFF
jgi:hypothetical protein